MKKIKKVKKIKRAKNKNRKINWKLITRIELVILAALLVIGGYWAYVSVPAVREAIALATTVKPETFTELYFDNHLSLPNKITYGQDNKFKFTIHNLENKDMNYAYEVYIDLNGEKQIIDQSSVFVKSGAYKTIDEDFTISLPTARVKVIANLINKNQQIDFWIEGVQ